MRTMDTAAYVSALRELTQQGNEVSVPIAGGSMAPFLADGRDIAFFRTPDSPLAVGDIVFYQRRNGQFVLHRICRIETGGLFLVGDAQREIEGPVDPARVFARVTRVRRKGRLIGPDDFWWRFFARVWVRIIPLRPALLALYGHTLGRRRRTAV